MSNTKATNVWDLDVRVRDRNLKNGTLADKDVEKMLQQLPDLEPQTDSVSTPQPALGGHGES
jgi:hypothetical protein